MGIQEIEIKGFRSLRDVKWKPGKLNVLIGQNGSGKSNLLRALELLERSVVGQLPLEILEEGGITPLLWDSKEREIYWRLTTNDGDHDLIYDLLLTRIGKTSSYRIQRETLQGSSTLLSRDASGKALLIDSDGREKTLNVEEGHPALSFAFEGIAEPHIVNLRDRISEWSVYSNLHVGKDALVRQPTVARFEKRLATDGQNLIAVLHTLYSEDRRFMETTNAAMVAAFGPDYEGLFFSPVADQRIQLRIGWKYLNTKQSAASLSDGTLRFLMLVAILANPDPGDFIAIDEPETGLHPRMFSIIAELALEAAERTQVVLTTHSPQFLDSFRDELPTTTVAELVEGETHLSVLHGENLKLWLTRYSLGDLYVSGQLEALA